jgi:NAD(P)-dependent dehydrogenase (short-subunit alcohol dehydrogenase family)
MSNLALITGANKGIGLETARQLASQGVQVLLGARDSAKGQAAADLLKAAGLPVTFLLIDVTDEASVKAAADKVAADYPQLDILINNAGVLLETRGEAPSALPLSMWRETFDTNVFGLVAVTQAFLPLLKRSPAARIVNLSSTLGSITNHANPESHIYHSKLAAYSSSKAAVNAWTVQLAYELRETPHKVNSAHPGWVQTDMGGAEAPMSIPDGAKTSVRLALLGPDGPSGGFFHMEDTLPW